MTLAVPELLQTKTYSAMRFRQVWLDMALQEGVVGANDLKVSQRALGGANLSVDVAAGSAFVQGDTTSRQGLYHAYNDAVVNLAIGSNVSGNPRIDQIICRVYDSQDGLAGADQATVEVVPGVATAAADLNNRNGAAALPLTAVRIADVLVASGAASITNSAIRDRRPWARGFNRTVRLTTGSTRSRTATTYAQIDPLWSVRGEFSGAPVRVVINGMFTLSVADANRGAIDIAVDGTTQGVSYLGETSFAGGVTLYGLVFDLPTLAAGSHLIEPQWASLTGGSISLFQGAVGGVSVTNPTLNIRETILQDSDNGVV